MPPYMYWPSDEAKIVYRCSAFDNRVLKADILDVLALYFFEAHTHKGTPSEWDEVYGGGKRVVRSTMAVAEVSGGRLLEIGFREYLRKPYEECSVFHARHL